jgi:kinesin family member C2/C3
MQSFIYCAFAEAVEQLQKVILDCVLSYKENLELDILKKVILKMTN